MLRLLGWLISIIHLVDGGVVGVALIDDVRRVLRRTSTVFDTEINDLILAAKADLSSCGVMVDAIDDTDPLIKQAINSYCRAYFGPDNKDTAQYQAIYEKTRDKLTQMSEYAFFAVIFTVMVGEIAIREAEVTLMGYTDKESTAGQIKYTDGNGQCVFYVRKGNNYKVSVSAEGYETYDNKDNLVDITASTTIDVELVVV